MQLDKKAIESFQALYREEFQEELAEDEARAMASGVLSLYLALARPLPVADSELMRQS